MYKCEFLEKAVFIMNKRRQKPSGVHKGKIVEMDQSEAIMPEYESENEGKAEGIVSIRRLKAGVVLASIFFLIYIPSFMYWISNDKINTGILGNGEIEQSFNTYAIIARDEVLLDAPKTKGGLILEVSDGERVPSSYVIASVSGNTTMGLIKELEKIDERILELLNEKAKKSSFFSEDISKINLEISEKINGIFLNNSSNPLNGLVNVENNINSLIARKASIAGDEKNDKKVVALKERKKKLQQDINRSTGRIISKCPGTVSFSIDGFEGRITPQTIEKLSINEILQTVNKTTSLVHQYDSAKPGKVIAKIIKGSYSYLVFPGESDNAGILERSSNLSVRINDIGMNTRARINSIKKDKEGKTQVILLIDRFTQELSSMRKINIDVITNSFKGLKVPLKSLFSFDNAEGRAKIMMLKANSTIIYDVTVVGSDNEFAIIRPPENEVSKTVSLYDTYILNPEKVKEGQIVLQ